MIQLDERQKVLANTSRLMYTLLRGTGAGKGWHDQAEIHFQQAQYLKYSDKFFQFLEGNDIDLLPYCVLACTISRAEHFRQPMKLYGRTNLMEWMKDLREYCGSSEVFKELSDVVFTLLEYQSHQITDDKKLVYFTFNNLLKDVESFIGDGKSEKGKKYLQTYYTLVDRIFEMKEQKVDPKLWIVAKYEKCIKAFKDNVAFSAIANVNSLDPDVSKLRMETEDEWRALRKFLGVSPSCEFPDGTVPKGWRPASGDQSKVEDIVKITKDGYYVYPDGSQRQGKRHHMNNSYFVINCTPDNFEEFRSSWDDVRMLSKPPTWEEYDKYGPEEKFWDKDGLSLTGRGKSVTWRKK